MYMINTFDELGFTVVPNLISQESCELLTHQFKMLRDVCHITKDVPMENKTFFSDRQGKNSFSYGRTPILEGLQTLLHKKIEHVVNKKLLPTYSYGRIYYTESELLIHKDKVTCEYSITICIKKDPIEWPIFIEDLNGNKNCISQNIGDALVYKGIELNHWRNKFVGDEHIQFFLHYVDAEGPYAEKIYDGRVALGLPKEK